MTNKEISCPICSADLPLSGDEKIGEEVFCTVCSTPGVLRGKPGDDDGFEVEEDL